MHTHSNIFLVGLMGTGKTTIGKRLAQVLNRPFADSDQEIERRTGVDIPTIFEYEGETGFRAREQAVLEELCGQQRLVLATGGGIVMLPKNRELLKSHGYVVHLYAGLEELLQRTGRDKNRPLLQNDDPRGTLAQLMQLREPLYASIADISIDTGSSNLNKIVDEIITALNTKQH